MKTGNDPRRELIQHQMTLNRQGKIDKSLWSFQAFAQHLVSIIGEKGFLVLYLRSLHQLQATYPLLPHAGAEFSFSSWISDLEIALTGQETNKANGAIFQLLMTLTNILASLIGEDLTVDICRTAWSDTAANRNPADKETKDD